MFKKLYKHIKGRQKRRFKNKTLGFEIPKKAKLLIEEEQSSGFNSGISAVNIYPHFDAIKYLFECQTQ